MATLALTLDETLMRDVEAICAEQRRDASYVARELFQGYVATERAWQILMSPELATLYEELADEDVAFAEAGMGDYQRLLVEADNAA